MEGFQKEFLWIELFQNEIEVQNGKLDIILFQCFKFEVDLVLKNEEFSRISEELKIMCVLVDMVVYESFELKC